jgi:hypothetical protein
MSNYCCITLLPVLLLLLLLLHHSKEKRQFCNRRIFLNSSQLFSDFRAKQLTEVALDIYELQAQ